MANKIIALLIALGVIGGAVYSVKKPVGRNLQTGQEVASKGQVGSATIMSSPVFGANIALGGGGRPDPTLIKSTGITATTYWLYLPQFTSNPDRAIRLFDQITQAKGNLSTYIHVMPQLKPQNRDELFHLPDMNQYLPQLTNLVNALKGKVYYYSISNEVPATWTGTLDHYKRLLSQSYSTIKKTDPKALVLDSGMSAGSLGVIIANSFYHQGKVQEAINFVNGYFKYHQGTQLRGLLPVSNELSLKNLLNNSEVARQLPYGQAMFTTFCPYYDVYEIHYYQTWDYLEPTLAWIKDQMQKNNCIKPIQFWEFGYGLDDPSQYDPAEHARMIPKYLTIAAAWGAQLVNYVTFYDKPGFATSLYTADGQPKPAATAFSTTINQLTGVTIAENLGNGKDMWIYKFHKASGDIYVVWSNKQTTVKLPINTTSAKVTDINGTTTTASPQSIIASTSPVFIKAN